MARQRSNGEGAVFRDGDRWIGRIPKALQHPGLRKTVSAPTQKDARTKLRTLRDEHIAARVENKHQFTDMTMGELVDKFAKTLPRARAAAKSTASEDWVLGKIKQALAAEIVTELRVGDIDDALQELFNEGVTAKTSLSRIRGMMSRIFDWAIDRDHCDRNPAARAALPSTAKPPREGVALEKDQVVRILGELVSHPMSAMYVMMMFLGLRPGEAAGLKVLDVDLEEGVLHVRRNMRYNDSGGPVGLAEVKTGNRGRGRRSLRMPQPVIDALRKRVTDRELQIAVYGDKGGWVDLRWKDVLFVTDDGNPPYMTYLTRPFRDAAKAIGLEGIRRYDARHTAATLLADQGFTLEQIADILGHEDTRMGRGVYTHVRGSRVIEGAVDLGS